MKDSIWTARVGSLGLKARIDIPVAGTMINVVNDPLRVQWRPMKAAWFDALIFDPHFGGQNCLSVAQALQAQLGNLMAMRQSLRIQIGVCWLQCLIELAGAGILAGYASRTRP